jgi:hypothetical protein
MIYAEYQRQIPGHFEKKLIDIRAVEVKIKKELNAMKYSFQIVKFSVISNKRIKKLIP